MKARIVLFKTAVYILNFQKKNICFLSRPPRPVNITSDYSLSHSMPTSGNPYSTKKWVWQLNNGCPGFSNSSFQVIMLARGSSAHRLCDPHHFTLIPLFPKVSLCLSTIVLFIFLWFCVLNGNSLPESKNSDVELSKPLTMVEPHLLKGKG